MHHLILHGIVHGFGRIWMFLRYPDKNRRADVLKEKFKDDYNIVGKRVFLGIVILIFVGELLSELPVFR